MKTSTRPFQLREVEPTSESMRRIVVHQLDKAIAGLSGDGNKPLEKRIHEVRKRLKRVRAALRVLRGPLGRKRQQLEDRRIRDAARLLSEARDAVVLVRTLDRLMEGGADEEQVQALRSLRAGFEAWRVAVEQRELSTQDRFQEVVALLRQTRRTIGKWKVEEEGWPVVARGIGWIYKQGRKCFQIAEQDPTVENLHEWRKRVKDLWYLFEIVRPVRPSYTQDRLEQAHQLADWLGDDHDLALLQQRLATTEGSVDAQAHILLVLSMIAQRRTALQASAFPIGARLYQERPKAFLARLETYWQAWRSELEAARFDGDGVTPKCPSKECEP